jgi:hypothetical protein
LKGFFDVVYKNGTISTQNDPRLGPSPESWEKRYWSQEKELYCDEEFEGDGTMRRLRFQNIPTEEETSHDPRPTSEALKASGVLFEDIIII